MSGPKSVKYVSKEELLETCRVLLEQYRAHSRLWLKRVARGGVSQTGDEVRIETILDATRKLLVREQTRDFQKRIAEELNWLEREYDRRVAEKSEAECPSSYKMEQIAA